MKGKLLSLLALLLVTSSLQSQIITEFHYDNIGNDVDEFVEFIIPNDGCFYSIALYNGTNGMTYSTSSTYTCTSPTTDICGSGIDGCLFTYEPSSIQNGNPDGIAIIQNCGGSISVPQFISYEGNFMAAGGAASGMMSMDIMVNETGTTPIGSSIVMSGSGYTVTGVATPGGCNNGTPLSILLRDFTARFDDEEGVVLDWETSSEMNNDYFVVEHSLDGRSFTALNKIEGAGTTNSKTVYEHVHAHAPNGANYYRLKQVDFNGQFTYSDIKEVFVKNSNTVTIRPTIVSNEVTIMFAELSDAATDILIYDIAGKLVSEATVSPNVYQQSINVSTLNAGSYFMVTNLNGMMHTSKFVKL